MDRDNFFCLNVFCLLEISHPKTRLSHIQATSEPNSSHIRATSESHPKQWRKLREKIGPCYGGVQNAWGEENSLGVLYRKNRATTPEGVENVPDEGRLFGRGALREVFLPLFFPAQHGVL